MDPSEEPALEELQSKKNKLRGVVMGLGTLMVMAFLVMLYVAVENKAYWLLAVGFAMPVTLAPSLIALSRLNSEIKNAEAKLRQ